MQTQIFNLLPDQLAKARAAIDQAGQDASVIPFENGPFNLMIVKDGTQEAEDRKSSPEVILGPLEHNGAQYLIAAK